MMSGLGRLKPPDWEHVRKFPLAALPADEQPRGIPVVVGFNWYSDFDAPEKKGNRWFVCPDGNIHGSIRGGHCFCIKASESDITTWWEFYNQGATPQCVGFGSSRCMTDLNRVRYDGTWLYNKAQEIGGYVGQEGAYVRDGLEALRTIGPMRAHHTEPSVNDGISAYRWAQAVEEVVAVLNLPICEQLEAVPFVNSWGRDYPHITWMPYPVLQRLIDEDGEVGIVTDK